MKILDFDYHNLQKEETTGTVWALGKFKSFHRGHQDVFSEAYRISKNKNIDLGIMIYPDGDETILTLQTRIELLEQYEPKYILVFEPNEQNYSVTQQEFLDWMKSKFNVLEYVVGEDFNFGKGNTNDFSIMEEYGKIKIVDLVREGKQIISTKLVKLLLEEGSIKKLNQVLGFNYIYEGEVIVGNQRGRELGFPTANVKVSTDIVGPKEGIYASYISVRGERYQSITSISTNPTFGTNEALEYGTYIFDFDQNIYGEKAFVELVDFIRSPIKFNDIDKLKEKMKEDVEIAKSILTEEN